MPRKSRVKPNKDKKEVFVFEDKLKEGQKGEELFQFLAGDEVERTDGQNGDFILKKDGSKIELKSDYYDINKTRNFFIERWSNWKTSRPGGPWQSLEHGCKYFVYFFVKNGVYFVFDTQDLVEYLEENEDEFYSVSIPNKGFQTNGYKVPRADLDHLYKQKEFDNFEERKKTFFNGQETN